MVTFLSKLGLDGCVKVFCVFRVFSGYYAGHKGFSDEAHWVFHYRGGYFTAAGRYFTVSVGISRGLYGIPAGGIREIPVFGRVPTKKKCAVKNPSAHRHFTDIAHNWGEVA